MKTWTASVLAVVVAACAGDGREVGEALAKGGYVVFVGTAATEPAERDIAPRDVLNCRTQRNLSAAGRRQAIALGEALRAVPLASVLTSPYCRARETATLAFGQGEATRRLIPPASAVDPAETLVLHAWLRARLASSPPVGTNVVLVADPVNLRDVAEIHIEEGTAAVFEPLGAAGFRLIGRLRGGAWAAEEDGPLRPPPPSIAAGR